jgi:hypothetical protein
MRRAGVNQVEGGQRQGSDHWRQAVVSPEGLEQRGAGRLCALRGGEHRLAKVQSGCDAAV